MPLVIMVGLPLSGKSYHATALKHYFEQQNHPVVLINDESLGISKSAYSCNDVLVEEKRARGRQMAAVERAISSGTIVILDAMNYIKGYRYQLHCIARSVPTQQCTVYVNSTPERVTETFAKVTDSYDRQSFEALLQRFEEPNEMNRWDAPLVNIQIGDITPCELIASMLSGAPQKQTKATFKQVKSMVSEVDPLPNIIQSIIKLQQDGYDLSSGVASIEGFRTKLQLTRPVTLPELRRHKREFQLMKKKLGGQDQGELFIQYLNSSQ